MPHSLIALRSYVGLSLTLSLAAGLASGLAVAAITIATAAGPEVDPRPCEVPAVAVPVLVPVTLAEPDPRARELALVITTAKASYIKLEIDASQVPHAEFRLVHEDGVYTAIASVRAEDLAFEARRWQGRRVVVDNTCEATVQGFAIMARLTGEIGYAGPSQDRERPTQWDASTVAGYGSPVLVARLDRCRGSYARDATLSAVVVPVERQDPELAANAKIALRESVVGQRARDQWVDANRSGSWQDNNTTAQVISIGATTWVVVHGHGEGGCSDLEINLLGLYRVAADRTLIPVQERELGDMFELTDVIDVDGDGHLELLGKSWTGTDVLVTDERGNELARTTLQFYGCPC